MNGHPAFRPGALLVLLLAASAPQAAPNPQSANKVTAAKPQGAIPLRQAVHGPKIITTNVLRYVGRGPVVFTTGTLRYVGRGPVVFTTGTLRYQGR